MTGEQLVDLVARDRDGALEWLVDEYRREIHDLCARISGSTFEADDLAQETFIRAYEHLGTFRGGSSPKTWLYRIAFNRCITFKRRLRRWRMSRIEDEEDIFETRAELGVPSGEEDVERRDLAARAHVELQKLPVRQRTAVILRALKGLPYAEIADVMGTSVGGAKANVHQGIRKLREAMGDRAAESAKPGRAGPA
ncbi:MAG: ECF RNA polymerase sigma factor SigW [Calditrichaeota bacterium]|nr:ECF RNA polymerase sigma factor SigW [Calditrichota bacterium]